MRLSKTTIKAILASAAAAAIMLVYTLFLPVTVPKDGAIFYLKPGTSRDAAIRELSLRGYIRFASIYHVYVHLTRVTLKSGEYNFAPGSTPFSIWRQITQGTGHHYRSFTIIPGWTFEQVKAELQNEDAIKSLIQSMSDSELMAALGSKKDHPEGMFLPETYYYQRDDSDLTILKRAYDLMQAKLNEAWGDRSKNLPYKEPYDALIAASLIEKEAYLSKERSIISGVLVNRLHKGMLLQFDPTVIYGMGDKYNGTIFKQDLVADTPYNTYVRKYHQQLFYPAL